MNANYEPMVMLNGDVVAGTRAAVSPLSEGFMFGRGVFETIRVFNSRPVFLSEHVARLTRSCAAVGVTWTSSLARVRERCAAVIDANALHEGSIKVLVFADVSGTGEMITARRFVYPKKKYEDGFRLMLHPRGQVGAVGPTHKTTSYLENLLAREAARACGADEALLVSAEGQVLEGSATNVFAVIGNEVLTPPTTMPILPGIARSHVLSRAGETGVKVREQRLTTDEVKAADEVFVTNALLGIMPVTQLEDRVYPVGGYPVTRALSAAYERWMRESAQGSAP